MGRHPEGGVNGIALADEPLVCVQVTERKAGGKGWLYELRKRCDERVKLEVSDYTQQTALCLKLST